MSKRNKGFRKGRKSDSDENEGHVRPIDVGRSVVNMGNKRRCGRVFRPFGIVYT
jgi:hypothetical protein